jgi:hypothetical protein
MSSSERTRGAGWLAGLEAAVVFSLILVYIWRLRFRYPYSWIAILGLVLASHWLRHEGPATLGFRWNSRGFAAIWVALASLAIALVSGGMVFHTIRDVSWQGAVASLLLYSIWGLVQQYLLNGYFLNRFSAFAPAGLAPLLAAIAFSLVHLPNWFLMIVALPGGYICARIYLAHRNLYILGAAHGIVGFLIYLTVPDTISHHLYVGPKWFSM